MQIVWAKQALPTTQSKAIFLAGPTPRSADVQSWRNDALQLLKKMGYDGHVFVPEPENGVWQGSYEDQRSWEDTAINQADQIVFWIPRDMQTMPGLTTNDEFGVWKTLDPMKVVLGTPETAAHVRYQRAYAKDLNIPVSDTLLGALGLATARIQQGAERSGGAAKIPLHVWRTPSFQQWYRAQVEAGNRLDDAKVLWTFRVGKDKSFLFSYAIHVNVYIQKENRNKTNEFIIGRPDVSTIVAFYPNPTDIYDYEIVMVQEFRSPAATHDGYILELPGGSSPKQIEKALEIAAHELDEETGLKIEPSRFKKHEVRQLAGTLSTHKAHLFSVALTKEEIEQARVKDRNNEVHGVLADTERTYVRVRKLRNILSFDDVDWSMVGMIAAVIDTHT